MKKQLIFAAAVLTLAACTNDDENLNTGDGQVAIRLSSSLEVMTRASSDIQSTAFNAGESVDVFISEDAQTPTTDYDQPLTYTTGENGAMNPPTGGQPYFPYSGNGVNIYAYYPAGTVTDMSASEVTFTVAADQSTDANYKASDLMYGAAANPVSRTSESIPVTFRHLLSKVTINLSADDGSTSGLTDVTVSLMNIRLNAKLTPSGGSVTDGTGNQIESVKVTTGTSGSAIVPVQTVAGGSKFIQVLLGTGDDLYYELPQAATFQSGKEYTYKIMVNLTGLTVTSSITDWTADDNYSGDNAGEALPTGADYTYDQDTNTYTVYTANGLLAWNEAVQSDLSLNCTLAADIDLTDIEYEWTLVGNNSSNRYTGTFEGGGYTIKGLTVNKSGTNNVGLIGYLGSGGKVQNLTLENVSITGSSGVGGVVGFNDDGGSVTACTVSGSVSGSSSVGGVVGYNDDYGTVTACYSTGNVYGTSEVGGVVGWTYGTVTACYSTGSVYGTSDSSGVGGVAGYNDGTMTACYSTGSVSATYTYNLGGVVGYNGDYGTVTACYWSGYDGDGISLNYGSDTPTKVDGNTVAWSDAVTGMNSVPQSESSEWRYELTGSLPTLTKSNE